MTYKIPRRCSKPGCDEMQPCQIPGHTSTFRGGSHINPLPDDWAATRRRFIGKPCNKCGKETIRGVLDHIVERADGGSHDPSNLQWLCKSCDRIKTRRSADLRRGRGKGKRRR